MNEANEIYHCEPTQLAHRRKIRRLLDPEAARSYLNELEDRLQLPCTDPVALGTANIIDHLRIDQINTRIVFTTNRQELTVGGKGDAPNKFGVPGHG